MQPQAYDTLTTAKLLGLCIWREARGEGILGKRGVAHVVLNRVAARTWFGLTVEGVILRPWQFSSFNSEDVNSGLWPNDADASWLDSYGEAENALIGLTADPTGGATYYFSRPLTAPPHGWGAGDITVVIGNLHFWKPTQGETSHV